jgi:hypothetical protein
MNTMAEEGLEDYLKILDEVWNNVISGWQI